MDTINHLAVIPDGNRRWAKEKGLPSFIGHQKGAENFEALVFKALEMDIKYFTFWGTSLDNITKRSESEVGHLYDIFEEQFNRLAKDERIHEKKVRVRVIGRWQELFPDRVKQAINKAVEITASYNSYNLNFMMAYNGDDEMLDCIQKIVKESPAEVSSDIIKAHLWTKELPSVDLIIRTGCEDDPHISAGFMMWDTAYSQLFFTEEYFPAFSPESFEKAITGACNRERRKGK